MQLLRIMRLSILLFCTAICLGQVPTRDNQIKAACVYNFTGFVDWPAGKFATANSPIVIATVGKNLFGDYLNQLAAGESSGTHPIEIKHFDSVDHIGECHILYINISDKKVLREILAKMSGRNVLTVSDAPGFAELGGMIRIYNANDKTNIQINVDAAKNESLIISTKLLKLAKIFKRK